MYFDNQQYLYPWQYIGTCTHRDNEQAYYRCHRNARDGYSVGSDKNDEKCKIRGQINLTICDYFQAITKNWKFYEENVTCFFCNFLKSTVFQGP